MFMFRYSWWRVCYLLLEEEEEMVEDTTVLDDDIADDIQVADIDHIGCVVTRSLCCVSHKLCVNKCLLCCPLGCFSSFSNSI